MSESGPAFVRDDMRMRAYLLGDLPEDESLQLEARYFEDEECYDTLLEAQYDLIDAYVRGALSPSEQRAVEQRLLASSDGPRQALVARALHQLEQRRERPTSKADVRAVALRSPSHFRNVLLAAAAAIAIATSAVSVWFGLESSRLRQELASLARPTAPPTPAQTPAPTGQAASDQAPLVAAVTLTARVLRGDQTPSTITIPAAARFVRLTLETEESASSFSLGVEKAGVGRIWTQSGLTTREDGALIVWLPADVLAPGDYEILLWREREDPSALAAVYSARVVRE